VLPRAPPVPNIALTLHLVYTKHLCPRAFESKRMGSTDVDPSFAMAICRALPRRVVLNADRGLGA